MQTVYYKVYALDIKKGAIFMKVDKTMLRTQYLQKRRALCIQEQQQKSAMLCHMAATMPIIQNSQHIGLYWPFDGEISPLSLLNNISAHKKQYYLPILENRSEQLVFIAYKLGNPLIKNRFGFYEPQNIHPDPTHTQIMPANDLDLILLPLVAFDAHGQRLGRGKGHYDRTLAFRKQKSQTQTPFLLGLGYSCQETPQIPTDIWDIALDGVLTEQGYSAFHTRSPKTVSIHHMDS